MAARPDSPLPPAPPASLSFFLAGPSSPSAGCCDAAPSSLTAVEAPGSGKSRIMRNGPLSFFLAAGSFRPDFAEVVVVVIAGCALLGGGNLIDEVDGAGAEGCCVLVVSTSPSESESDP